MQSTLPDFMQRARYGSYDLEPHTLVDTPKVSEIDSSFWCFLIVYLAE